MTPLTYVRLGRKWVQVPIALKIEPKQTLPKQNLDQPRGYRHIGMDHF